MIIYHFPMSSLRSHALKVFGYGAASVGKIGFTYIFGNRGSQYYTSKLTKNSLLTRVNGKKISTNLFTAKKKLSGVKTNSITLTTFDYKFVYRREKKFPALTKFVFGFFFSFSHVSQSFW